MKEDEQAAKMSNDDLIASLKTRQRHLLQFKSRNAPVSVVDRQRRLVVEAKNRLLRRGYSGLDIEGFLGSLN
jgi:hypothetical protein